VRAYVRRYALDNRRLVGPPETRGARRVRGHVRATERRIAQEHGRQAEPHEVAAALGVKVEDLVEADAALRARDVPIGPAPHGMDPPSPAASPESEVSEAETRALVKRRLTSAFDGLTARERQIVVARHLNDERPSLNLLGERLGVSRERVRQLQIQAEHKLRSALVELVA
jgi:RNA polymerase sigma-32 factor